MHMAKNDSAQQQQLFIDTETKYGWKSVKEIQRGDLIVIMDLEVKIQQIKTDEDFWSVTYHDPLSEKKVEQLFTATDWVYAKLS